jgi:hypothetical protein
MAHENSALLTVKDLSNGQQSEMTPWAYDQVRFEKWNGKDRYKLIKGTANKVAEKK